MKLIKITKLSPKRLFGSKKSVVSRSEPSSFSSGTMSSSSSDEPSSSSVHKGGSGSGYGRTTPPDAGEWSDTEMNFELCRFRSSKSIESGHGVVSRAELEALLRRLGASDEAALMLREAGCGDEEESCLSVEELLGQQQGPVGDEELRETFEFFDEDGDGRITAEELLGVFTTVLRDERCTLEDCRRMVAEVDSNGDGFVCFQDFNRMMGLQI